MIAIFRTVATCALGALMLQLSACSPSRTSSVQQAAFATHPVSTIAIAPSGGLLADAVAVELSNRGLLIYDSATTSSMLTRLGMSEIEIMQPANLGQLRERGIDAYLSVRAVSTSDGKPQSASARLSSTHTGQIISGTTWQNGWGGMRGSIADRVMRRDLSEAAEEIAQQIERSLRRG